MIILFFIRDVIKKFPILLLKNTLFIFLESIVGIASIFSIAPVIDIFTNPALHHVSLVTRVVVHFFRIFGIPISLTSVVIFFILLQVLKSGMTIFLRYTILKTKYIVLNDLMLGTFEAFLKARWEFFSSNKQGTLSNTFVREISVVGDAFAAMALLFANFLELIIYVAVLTYLSWQITAMTVLFSLLFSLPFLLFGKLSYRLGKMNTTTANEMVGVILESLGSAKIVLGFGNQQKSVEKLASALKAHQDVTIQSQTLEISTPLIYQPLGVLILVIVLFTAQRIHTPMSEIGVILWALFNTIPLVGGVITRKNALTNLFPSYEQVIRLKNQAVDLVQVSGDRIFTGLEHDITLENLTFAYPGHDPVLIDLNLLVPKGKMVAVVGQSGVGKSTLIDLILGFQNPIKGDVKIDSYPLPEFDILSFRKRIGYVPQDSVLFNMSIRDNLLWANEYASGNEIIHACQQANAYEFIEKFPKGLDTLVGDRGVRLSGGQRQRIALARAILRRPALLILDEATSFLDTHSERLIQDAIEVIAKETTVVVIAHRLSTIIHADYIYVLQNGRVLEEGTYQSLLEKNGHFYHMAQLQHSFAHS